MRQIGETLRFGTSPHKFGRNTVITDMIGQKNPHTQRFKKINLHQMTDSKVQVNINKVTVTLNLHECNDR